MTVGIKHFAAWKINGKNLVKTKGKISRNNCLLVSVIADGDRVLTGSGENYLTEWRGASSVKKVDLSIEITQARGTTTATTRERKPIESILLTEQHVIAGGKNTKISILNRGKLDILAEVLLSSNS